VSTDKYADGQAVRRQVLGDAYVEASIANATDFNREFQALVAESCWGTIWTRDGLPRQTRSLLNLVMMVALNRPHELDMHVKGALRNGVSVDAIKESLLQAAVYCGIPAGVDAFRVAAKAIADFSAETESAPAAR
jgi:4-carboxymuconolactone decarboxylase